MPLKDPIAAYNAENNMESYLVRDLLADANIEAYVTDDQSMLGLTTFGTLSEIYKIQVWIERDDAQRAIPVIEEYERRLAARRAADAIEADSAVPIEVACEECGETTSFPRAQQGSVQSCPHCHAYVDVSLDNTPEECRIQSADDLEEDWRIQSTDDHPS